LAVLRLIVSASFVGNSIGKSPAWSPSEPYELLSLARSTMPSSMTLFSNNRKVQRTRPLGQFGFLLAIENPRNGRCRSLLAAQHSLEALFHQLLAHPVNHGHAGSQSLDDPAVTAPFTSFRDIGLQQYPCRRCAELLPFRSSVSSRSRSSPLSLTTYLFTEISFASMIASVARSCDESESLTDD
jgi:hypothetical protein